MYTLFVLLSFLGWNLASPPFLNPVESGTIYGNYPGYPNRMYDTPKYPYYGLNPGFGERSTDLGRNPYLEYLYGGRGPLPIPPPMINQEFPPRDFKYNPYLGQLYGGPYLPFGGMEETNRIGKYGIEKPEFPVDLVRRTGFEDINMANRVNLGDNPYLKHLWELQKEEKPKAEIIKDRDAIIYPGPVRINIR